MENAVAQFFAENLEENEVRLLESNNANDRAVLERTLKELFPPNFPPEEANEALRLIEQLDNPISGAGNIFKFILMGNHLQDPDKAVVKGLSLGLFFPKSQSASVWYLVTDRQYRQQGIAKTLVFETAKVLEDLPEAKGPLQGFFVQIHDPEIQDVVNNDPFDSRKRVAFYERLNSQRVAIPLFYSPVKKDDGTFGESIPYMLVAVPTKQDEMPWATKEIVRNHITDYYGEYGVQDPHNHPDFLTMMSHLDALTESTLLTSLSKGGGSNIVKIHSPKIQ